MNVPGVSEDVVNVPGADGNGVSEVRCTAISRSTGQRCKNSAMTGYSVCWRHAAAPAEAAAPAYTDAADASVDASVDAPANLLEAALTSAERRYLRSLSTDPLDVLLENLRVLKVREARGLQRLQRLREAEALEAAREALEAEAREAVEDGGAAVFDNAAARDDADADAAAPVSPASAKPARPVKKTATSVGAKSASASRGKSSAEAAAQIMQRWEKGLTEIQEQIRRTAECISRLMAQEGKGAQGGREEQGVSVVLNLAGGAR